MAALPTSKVKQKRVRIVGVDGDLCIGKLRAGEGWRREGDFVFAPKKALPDRADALSPK